MLPHHNCSNIVLSKREYVGITYEKSLENTTWCELGNQTIQAKQERSESHLLGDKIRNEETIRPRTVVVVSSEPCAASEKVKLCSRSTVTQKKNKRLLANVV